jgi:hypothetical protein
MWSLTEIRRRSDLPSMDHCLREAGAGGSNPLTTTSIPQHFQQLTAASAKSLGKGVFPRKPYGSPRRKFPSHFVPQRHLPPLCPGPPRAPAREGQSRPLTTALHRIASPEPSPTRSRAGSPAPARVAGPIWPDRGTGGRGFPPTGGLGPICCAGGPGQSLDCTVASKSCRKFAGLSLRDIRAGKGLGPWQSGRLRRFGRPGNSPKPLRNRRESPKGGRGLT